MNGQTNVQNQSGDQPEIQLETLLRIIGSKEVALEIARNAIVQLQEMVKKLQGKVQGKDQELATLRSQLELCEEKEEEKDK